MPAARIFARRKFAMMGEAMVYIALEMEVLLMMWVDTVYESGVVRWNEVLD